MTDLRAWFDDTAFPLVLTVDQESVGGATGLSPTLRIRDAATTDSYLDFDDNTFKTFGWVQQDVVLGEIGRGQYQYLLNVAAVAVMVDGFLAVVEYALSEPGFVGSAHETLRIADETTVPLSDIAEAVRDVALEPAALDSLGEAILVAKNTKFAFRIDNFTRDPDTGFGLTARYRVFRTQAEAAASTKDAPGLEGAIASGLVVGEADGAFRTLPDDVLGS